MGEESETLQSAYGHNLISFVWSQSCSAYRASILIYPRYEQMDQTSSSRLVPSRSPLRSQARASFACLGWRAWQLATGLAGESSKLE